MSAPIEDDDVDAKEKALATLRQRIRDTAGMLSATNDLRIDRRRRLVMWSPYLAGMLAGVPIWMAIAWLLLMGFLR